MDFAYTDIGSLTRQQFFPQNRVPIQNPTPMLSTSLNTGITPTIHHSVDQMAANNSATILGLIEPEGVVGRSGLLQRLSELGFLPGENVTVLRRGPGGREPIAVQIGETVFALRSIEASCIEVDDGVMARQA